MTDTEKAALCARIDELCAEVERLRSACEAMLSCVETRHECCSDCGRWDARMSRCTVKAALRELGIEVD